jgi:tetratricopeptide (TPR) repeat protein
MRRWTRYPAATPRLAPDDAFFQGGLLCLLAGSVYASGGATIAARTAAEAAALLLGALALLRMAWRQRLWLVPLRLSLPFWLLIGLGALQLLPLPVAWRAVLGVAREHTLRLPLVAPWQPLSLNPEATVAACWLLAAAGGVFVVCQLAVSPSTARPFAALLVTIGGVIAGASIVGAVDPDAALPTLANAAGTRAHGPFLNPDHFANWLAALLPLALAGALSDTRRSRRTRAYLLASLLALPFMATALGLTFSRGGCLAALCGLVFFALGLLSRRRRVRLLLAAAAAICVASVFVAWGGGGRLGGRFLALWEDPLANMRVPIWSAATAALLHTPVLGAGLGAFLEAARPFVGASIPSRTTIDFAHNELLQLGTEGGIVGLAIGAAGLAYWLRALARARRDKARRAPSLLSRGAEAGVIALLAGAMVDFALRVPANALLGAVLAGLAVAAERGHETPRSIGRPACTVLAAVAIATVALALPHALRTMRAARLVADATRLAEDGDWNAAMARVDAAVALQPRSAAYRALGAHLLADAARRASTERDDGRPLASDAAHRRAVRALYVEAVTAQLDAIARDRTNPTYRKDLAFLIGDLGLREGFSLSPSAPSVGGDPVPIGPDPSTTALQLYQDAVDLEPRNAALHQALGEWALQNLGAAPRQTLCLSDPGTPLEHVAVRALRTAIALDPARQPHLVATAIARGADYADIRALTPDDPATRWRLAVALESQQRFDWTDRVIDELLAEPSHVSFAPETGELAERIALRPDAGAARPILARLAAAPGAPPGVLAALANTELRLGDSDAAQADLAAALDTGPPEPWRTRLERDLGFLLIERNDLAAADACFARWLQQRPHDPWVYLGIGMIADRRGDWPAASRAYERAHALAGDADDLYYRLGHRYFARGLPEQAAAVWEDGLHLDPDNAEMHLWVARAYAKTRQPDRAIRHYAEAVRLQPNNREARDELDALLGKHAE